MEKALEEALFIRYSANVVVKKINRNTLKIICSITMDLIVLAIALTPVFSSLLH